LIRIGRGGEEGSWELAEGGSRLMREVLVVLHSFLCVEARTRVVVLPKGDNFDSEAERREGSGRWKAFCWTREGTVDEERTEKEKATQNERRREETESTTGFPPFVVFPLRSCACSSLSCIAHRGAWGFHACADERETLEA
jgi:hypothetical protein